MSEEIKPLQAGREQMPDMASPRKLFVETTSRCNMGCIMCVKQSPGRSECDGDISSETFSALRPAFSRLEALILNGIGEPLLHPGLESFIRTAKENLPPSAWVGFQTNGLLLDALRAKTLAASGIDKICISVDSASAENFRNVRHGGELPAVASAFNTLSEAKNRCGRPDLQVGMEFVLMRRNRRELPETLRWASKLGATFAIVTHLLPYNQPHTMESAYDTCSGEAVDLFKRYREEALKKGLDINDYPEARWKFTKSPREKELLALVDNMKNEAEERGVFLDMKKLLRLEYDLINEVSTLFHEAREVATECGIDLRLPEISPSEKRRCSFVEEGSAFVSWEGDVSPCYFLWHRYMCYASGWSQQVQPKVFGNLKKKGILEIWNDPAFRVFRDNVLAYDYPVCSSCTLAPCDYVQTEEFIHDCHIMEVPCGSCLWCMGLFHCLR
jgi:putative metalloenzyme radical SAM/SPASM domain maturase